MNEEPKEKGGIMKKLFIVLIGLALSGCMPTGHWEHEFDVDEREFHKDSAECQQVAQGLNRYGSYVDRDRFAQCMTGRGYNWVWEN